MPGHQRNSPDFPFDRNRAPHPIGHRPGDNPEKDVSNDTTQDVSSDPDPDPNSDRTSWVNPNVSTSPAPKPTVSYPKYHNLIKRQRWNRTDTDPKTGLQTKTRIDMVNNPGFMDRLWDRFLG